MPIKGSDVAIAGVGGLFVYAGIRGYSPLKGAQNVIQGQPVSAGQTASLLGGVGSGSTLTTDSQIANTALRYVGHPYKFGGAPGRDGKNPWDCSSMDNWVLGHDLGLTLPGSSSPGYDGMEHGPDTIEYLSWDGAETVGHNAGVAQAGDLCVWQTHMGIAIGNGQMVSAENPSRGTRIDPIHLTGEVLFVRRVRIA